MPLYDYRCRKCGHEYEVLQRASDTSNWPCTKCGSRETEKLIPTMTGFQLRGNGWYETDFKNGGNGNSGGADGAGSASTGGEA